MISRFLLLCAYSLVLLLVASSSDGSDSLTKNSISTQLCGSQDVKKNIWNEHEIEELNETPGNNRSEFVLPWYTDVPLLPIVFATSETLSDGPCKMQAQRYLTDLKNGTLWATQSEYTEAAIHSYSLQSV